jgi:hypothetical protein
MLRDARSLLSMRLFCFNTLDLILRGPPSGRLEGWGYTPIYDSSYQPVPNALKVMMVWVSWMPGMTWTFSLTKWPMSVSLST